MDMFDALGGSFARHGWRQDLRYGADGPDGATVGMRLHDVLCMLRTLVFRDGDEVFIQSRDE